MTQEFLNDDLTDEELLKKCIMSLSDTILYTNALIDRQYKLEVKRDDIDIGAIGLALLLRKIPE